MSFTEDKHTEPVLSLSRNEGAWMVNDTRQILVLPNSVPWMHLMLAELSGQRSSMPIRSIEPLQPQRYELCPST